MRIYDAKQMSFGGAVARASRLGVSHAATAYRSTKFFEEPTKSISEAKDFISKASATIKAQKTNREIEDKTNGKKTIAKREYNFDAADEQKFFEIVESIIGPDNLKVKQSMVLTWDEIIDSMDEKSDNTSGIVSDTEKLRIFYKTALTEIKRK